MIGVNELAAFFGLFLGFLIGGRLGFLHGWIIGLSAMLGGAIIGSIIMWFSAWIIYFEIPRHIDRIKKRFRRVGDFLFWSYFAILIIGFLTLFFYSGHLVKFLMHH